MDFLRDILKFLVLKVIWGYLVKVWTIIGVLVTFKELSDWLNDFFIIEIIKEIEQFFDNLFLPCFLIGFVIYLIISIYKQLKYDYEINSEVHIKIRIGNILMKKGNIIIGTNSTLVNNRTKIGVNSIHYQLLNQSKKMRREIEEAFVQRRNETSLEMGEFISVLDENKKRNYIFLVMSKLEVEGNPHSKKQYVVTAMKNLLDNQDNISGITGNKLFCPLLGKGAAGESESFESRIKLLVKLYAKYVESNETLRFKQFIIVLRLRDYLKIKDWKLLKKELDVLINNCTNCSNYTI